MSCEENESFCVSKSVKPGAISLPLDLSERGRRRERKPDAEAASEEEEEEEMSDGVNGSRAGEKEEWADSPQKRRIRSVL
jgi:hypothetical protein